MPAKTRNLPIVLLSHKSFYRNMIYFRKKANLLPTSDKKKIKKTENTAKQLL